MIMESICTLMKQKGQRITKQKKIILSVFIVNRNTLLSVNQIMEMLPEFENVNNVTVYRNIQNFLKLGILETMVDDKGAVKYVIRCNDEHHHHLICLECGKMIPIKCDKNRFSSISREFGFEEVYHNFEVYGTCKECGKKK